MCVKIVLNIVVLRNYVKDAGNEASVGNENFLSLPIMNVYFREKSSKKTQMSDSEEKLSCAIQDIQLHSKSLEKSVGHLSSVLEFPMLLKSHVCLP